MRLMKVRANRHSADVALEIVDTALVFAGRRRVFTRHEAMELLRGVLVKVDDPDIESVLAPIVDRAQSAYGDIALVERPGVVDPLLDMRLVLVTSHVR